MSLSSSFNGRNIPIGETVYIGETRNPYFEKDPLVVKKATVLKPRRSAPSNRNIVLIAFWEDWDKPPGKKAERHSRHWQFLLTEDQVRRAARLDKEAPALPEEYPIDVIAAHPDKSRALAMTIACAGLGRAIPTVSNLEAIPLPERQ